MKTSGSALLTLCEGDPPKTVGLPQQMANNAESFPLHDVFMIYFDWGYIQSSVVITRSNISAYCIYRLRNWGRISIMVELLKDTMYLALTGKLRRAFRKYIWEADHVNNGTALYVLLGTRARKRLWDSDFLFRLPPAKNVNGQHHWPFVRGIHRLPLNSPNKVPITPKTFA